jgi:release factor glutamine methyltransferase
LSQARKIWRVIDIVRWATDFFRSKGIESPRLNIELLLCELLGIGRVEIYSQFDKPLKEYELARLREMVKRRAKREPLQYIIGHTEFLGLKIICTPQAIVPRPETELLADQAIKTAKEMPRRKILDIGCGSGCISIAIAKQFPGAEITAVDNSKDSLRLARRNANLNQTDNIYFMQCNIFENISFNEKFDIVVSNPPYISNEEFSKLEPEVRIYEPAAALTDSGEGLAFYRRYAEIMPKLLLPGGVFILEIGAGQSREAELIFSDFEFSWIEDLAGHKRIIQGRIAQC